MGQTLGKDLKEFLLDTDNEATIKKIFARYDKDKSGHLDFQEFKLFAQDILKVLAEAEGERKEEEKSDKLKKLNSSARIQVETKLSEHLRILAEVSSFKEFKNFDKNNDGTISYEEFVEYVQKVGTENNVFL